MLLRTIRLNMSPIRGNYSGNHPTRRRSAAAAAACWALLAEWLALLGGHWENRLQLGFGNATHT
jgi:hypothetical protein